MTSVRTDDEIRSEVQKHYGSRVQDTLDAADQLEIVSAGAASCCETTAEDACCGSEGSAEDAEKIAAIASRLYGEGEVDDLPSTVTDVSFGCGNPTAISALTVGQTVLDLGSGGGIDVFLAAKMVGDTGRVYGVDMTPNMIDLARSNAKKVGAENVEFRLGEIERLPIDSDTVDVIISNCVINLSPDKGRGLRRSLPRAPPRRTPASVGHRLDEARARLGKGRHGSLGRLHRRRASRG